MKQEYRFLKDEIAKELDFYIIREEIAQFALSDEGKKEILSREATGFKNIERINELKNLGRQWTTYLTSDKAKGIRSWPGIKEWTTVLKVEGSSLSHDQLYALGLFCRNSNSLKEQILSASEDLKIPDLQKQCENLFDLTPPMNEIFSILTLDGEIKDLPVLREIKNNILKLKKEVENSIRKWTSDSKFNSILQSNVPAFKQDRQLLAVRADKRNQIDGIVHEVSSTGNTLYIEPLEVVKANNELLEEEYRLQNELNKIFKELTQKISIYRTDLETNEEILNLLDSTYAAARYGIFCNGIFAEDCSLKESVPKILRARHPLLKDKAVPVDIEFMDGKKVTIITGPNTGGKTVTLKTVALFCLMNQAGFPIPAMEGTKLPVFNSIFADIGDEQSIQNSLSTFSSHMKKTALMTEMANAYSLVLLDELASGTDPQEGSAIAMAALDELIKKDAFVLATTHHGILKNYGYTNPKCINASVEFNTDTLQPTYRLLMGVPGESHAIDIAQKSGLNSKIIQKAKNYISTQAADVSVLIQGLTKKHEELDSLLKIQKEEKIAVENLRHKLLEKEIKLKEKEIELKKEEHSTSTEFLRTTRSQLENLVRELREGEITREKTLKVKSFISELENQIDAQTEKIEEEKKLIEEKKEEVLENGIRLSKLNEGSKNSNKKTKKKLSNKEALKLATATEISLPKEKQKKEKTIPLSALFIPGREVLAGPTKLKGTLVNEVKPEIWCVQIGSIKMNFKKLQLTPLMDEKTNLKADYELITESDASSKEFPKWELRLLGMRYEDAMKEVEKQLDLCAIHNFKNFSIIHGKGNGILQQGVHNLLSHYPGVKEFHFANPEDGGFGKTYVELN